MARLNDKGSVLRRLGLAEGSLRQQAEFFVAYAEMLESRSPGSPRTGDDDDVWARIANPAQRWLGEATLASTYRLAAQYAALVDARWSTELTVRAGRAYLDAGMPFGLFLLTGVLEDQIVRNDFVRSALLAPLSAGTAEGALADPAQQAYLLLAAASRPWLRDFFGEPVGNMLRRLDAHGLYPVGPQSIPLEAYLSLARTMLSDESGNAGMSRLSDQLAVLGRAQVASLRAARQNRYLWERGAASVNVVDLEYVAMTGLALRHDPTWFDELSRSTTDALAGDDALAELPVWVMGRINRVLPQMTGTVVEILIGPEDAWPEPPGGAYDVRPRDDVSPGPGDDEATRRYETDLPDDGYELGWDDGSEDGSGEDGPEGDGPGDRAP